MGALPQRQWHSFSGGGLRYRLARLENRSASQSFWLDLQRLSGRRETRESECFGRSRWRQQSMLRTMLSTVLLSAADRCARSHSTGALTVHWPLLQWARSGGLPTGDSISASQWLANSRVVAISVKQARSS